MIENGFDYSTFDIAREIDLMLGDILPCKNPSKTRSGIPPWEDRFNGLMDDMAARVCHPKVYLFSVDPGLGKSAAAIKYIARCKAERFRRGAILVLVSRLDEIRRYIKESRLGRDDYAVLVAQEKSSLRDEGVGYLNAGRAPVLFTTQQMLETRMGSGSFAAAAEFHYRGTPRPMRIWDETIEPAKAVAVSVDDLGSLAAAIRPVAPRLVDALDEWLAHLRTRPTDTTVTVPSAFSPLIDEANAEQAISGMTPKQRNAVASLAALCGREAELRKDGNYGYWLAGYGQRIPDDLKPLVVLDASGSVRGTYDVWDRHGDDLVRMPAVRSSYSNLTVLVHKTASGKGTSRDPRKNEHIIKIASDLLSSNNEEWLVVHHKDDSTDGIKEILKKVVPNPDRLKFVHWGNHHGTNEFRDIRKVLVMGMNTYPSAMYRSMQMAAADRGIAGLNEPECREVREAEYCHHLLQAIMRCNARNHVKGECGNGIVYLLAAPKTNPEIIIRKTFPDARIRPCHPESVVLKGRQLQIVSSIRNALALSGGAFVAKSSIWADIGIDPSNGARALREVSVISELNRGGIKIVRGGFIYK